MVNLPAVCRNCGYTFQSGIVVINSPNGLFSGNKARCPQCGQMAEILDATTDSRGNLNFSKSAYEVLNSPSVDKKTLEKLTKIIAYQQKLEKPNKADLVKAIQTETPEASALVDLLIPTNSGEFYGLLSFILALILFIQAMRGSKIPVSPMIINNFYGTENPQASAYDAAHKCGQLRRKDPCPCGSGKKFKNCHGN